jgi:hypothetical protein
MVELQHTSRSEERKRFIVESMLRLQRPIWLGDLSPRASEFAAYEKAFRALLAEGRIALDSEGAYGRKYYRLVTLPSFQR